MQIHVRSFSFSIQLSKILNKWKNNFFLKKKQFYDSRGSLSKQISDKTNTVTRQKKEKGEVLKRILRLSRQETLRLIFYQRKRQNSAGANRRGGEEGARGDARCEVSAGRNIETAEPVIIISHPLTSLPKMSEFNLPLSFFLLEPAHPRRSDRRRYQNTNLCLFVSAVGDPTMWEGLNQWTVLN